MTLRVRVAVLAALLALQVPLGARAADPYDLYVIIPLTGPASFLGQGIAKTLAVEEGFINKHGGVRGRPVHFVIQDDQSSPQVTVQLTNDLIAKKVPVIIGSAISAMCQAQAGLAKDGPVIWCLSPGVHPPAGSYVFANAQETQDYVEACLRYAMGKGWHKIAVISTTDASGQDFDLAFDRLMSRPDFRSIAVVAREHFGISDFSVAAVVSKVKSGGPDAILGWVTGTAEGTMLRDLTDAGLDLPVFSSPVNLIWSQIHTIQSVMPNSMLFPATAAYTPNLLKGPLKRVVVEYQDTLHAAGIEPDQGTAVPWTPPLIVIEALNKYGTEATAAQIRQFIASYVGPGVMGQYNFPAHPQRGLDASTVVIIRYDKSHQSLVGVSYFGGAPL
jgi:branched-chain amino acid transport system substrate-binding protein